MPEAGKGRGKAKRSRSASPVKKKKTKKRSLEWDDVTKKHPFIDRSAFTVVATGDMTVRDAEGNVLVVFKKGVLPEKACSDAASVLRQAARYGSNRANIYGGNIPNTGIAGYYDYHGSMVQLKCRKTAFTYDYCKDWKGVFPVIDYVNEAYKTAFPRQWKMQDDAIPDNVRIHGSVFSTVTVNQAFRTALHTDCGDFDNGFGVITVLEGNFKGVMLGFPAAKVCLDVRPGDLVLFNTHCWHGNTEVELPDEEAWNRLACVFYYRYKLGEEACYNEYARRKVLSDMNPSVKVVEKNSGTNHNRPHDYIPARLTPVRAAMAMAESQGRRREELCEALLQWEDDVLRLLQYHEYPAQDAVSRAESIVAPQRELLQKMNSSSSGHKYQGGFSVNRISELEKDVRDNKTDGLDKKASLRKVFGDGLADEWFAARKKWLDLVDSEYKAGTPGRFTWKNKGKMQDAFTELCEVSQAMFESKNGIESMSEASPSARSNWWMGFAVHLSRRCLHDLAIPQGALHLRKLDTKLKDFEFGGTRYFGDLSPEEQQRREKRRERLRKLRTNNQSFSTRPRIAASWMENDVFDYQTEDAEVDYDQLALPTPEALVKQLGLSPVPEKHVAKGAPQSDLRCLHWHHGLHTTPEARAQLSTGVIARQLTYFDPPPRVKGVPVAAPSDGSKPVDVILASNVLTGLSDDALLLELRCVSERLTPDGLVLFKDFSADPWDTFRLTQEGLEAVRSEWKAAVDVLYAGEAHPRNVDRVIGLLGEAGLRCNSIFQVEGSALHEYCIVVDHAPTAS